MKNSEKQAIRVIVNFVQNHIITSDLQNDKEYTEEIEAIKILNKLLQKWNCSI